MKEKVPGMNIPEELNNHGYTGWHHPATSFNFGKYTDFTVAGLITGCGAGQIKGVFNLSHISNTQSFPEFKKKFLTDINAHCLKTGIGMLICTLGSAYYINEPYLLDLGFKLISEYRNHRHNDDSTQRMYHLVINK